MLENVKKRNIEDTVEIEGRNFKIKKFDPLMGNYILATLFTYTLPFGLSDIVSDKTGIKTDKTSTVLDKKSFIEFQRDILSTCYEVLPAGLACVVNEGGYGISNFTTNIAFQLIIASIAYNFSDFFVDILSNSREEEQTEA